MLKWCLPVLVACSSPRVTLRLDTTSLRSALAAGGNDTLEPAVLTLACDDGAAEQWTIDAATDAFDRSVRACGPARLSLVATRAPRAGEQAGVTAYYGELPLVLTRGVVQAALQVSRHGEASFRLR